MSICCVLTLVTIEDMKIHQMDVKIAFLNGDLEEEIYMEQPQGFTQGGEHLVCKLHKSLYGLNNFQMHFENIEFVSDVDFIFMLHK